METLKQKYQSFCKKPFPENFAINPVVSDLFMDLADYDSYISGLIDQAINGKKVKSNNIFYDQKLEDQLRDCLVKDDLDEVSRRAVMEYISYLQEIKCLLDDLN
jgi:hypothetical protein